MSHIIKSNEDIVKLSLQFETLRNKGWNENTFEEITNELIPTNPNTNIKVEITNSKTPACFSMLNEEELKIIISPSTLYNYINYILFDFSILYPQLKKEALNFCTFWALLHEIEHYYQYLIAKEYIEFPYQIVSDAYKFLLLNDTIDYPNPNILFNLLIEKHIRNRNCLIEKNATIEAISALIKVADYEIDYRMLNFLKSSLYKQLIVGYQGVINNGRMEATFRKIFNHQTFEYFNHTEDIPLQDKIRYGLPIDTKSRKKLLKQKIELDFNF